MVKVCHRCQVKKPLEDFGKCSRRHDQKQDNCKECLNRANRARYASGDKEGHRDRCKRWREENEIKHSANSARWYAENRERRAETALKWRAENPEVNRASAAKRRLLKKQYEGQHYTGTDIVTLLEAQRGLCVYCDVALNGTYHVDHIVPLSKGGSNGPENICITCPPCNMSKHGRILGYEWCACGAAQGGRYR